MFNFATVLILLLLSIFPQVNSFLYLTVPNPFTDTGRGCRVYYFENNEQLSLREVPWECSVVFYESQFWKPNNVSLLERAIKREEIAELSNFITISCGDSQSLRTFAVHEKMEVCLFVNSEGSIDFAWSEISPKNEYNSNSKSPQSTIRRYGATKLYWPGRRLSRDPKGLFLAAGFDGDSLHIVATSRYNNHMMHAEAFVGDILNSFSKRIDYDNNNMKKNDNNEKTFFLFQQTVNNVPRLAPENYRSWFTGPGRYKHVHGLNKRPGTHCVRSGVDRVIESDQKQKYHGESNEEKDLEKPNVIDKQDEDESHHNADNNIDVEEEFEAFGMHSGGYEPDVVSKNIELETVELNKAMELFRGNNLKESKKIYERILNSRKFNRVNAHNTQAARFNLGSVLYRLHSYEEAVGRFDDLMRDHKHLLQMEKDEPSDPPNQFEYMQLVYNLLGDMLFYRSPNIAKGLDILYYAKDNVHNGDIKMINHINAIIQKWSMYWKEVADKNVDHVMGLANAGTLLYEIGQVKEAKTLLQRVQTLNPKHSFPKAYFNLAMIEINAKKYTKARRYLSRYTKLKKKSYIGWIWRGRAVKYDAKNGKDYETSLRLFERARKLEPQRHEGYVEAIQILRRHGDKLNSVQSKSNKDNKNKETNVVKKKKTWSEAKLQTMIKQAIKHGALQHSKQYPMHFVKGLPSKPWYSRNDLLEMGASRIVHMLETKFHVIQDEVLQAFKSGKLINEGIDDTEGLTTEGKWTELNLYHMGRKFEKNCNILPKTTAVLERMPEIVSQVKGATKISVLQPGTKIREHNGPSNTRIRLHLGIQVPDGASITVGGIKKTWKEGKLLAFDDSFIHSVEHNGDTPRIALIADIWHPLMTEHDIISCLETNEELERYLYRQSLFSSETGVELEEEVALW